MKRKNGFTLIELIAVLVILAILALIVTPLVMNIIRKARISADKRSVDVYGRSIELAIAGYLLDTGKFPTEVSQLTIEYSGNEVVCETTQINTDSSVYLAGCTVAGRNVENYTYGEDKTPQAPTYTAYQVGDEVTYNNVDYYVIKDSSSSEEIVKLLKAEPLTVAEVNEYGAGHVNRYTIDSVGTASNENGYGGMAYYASETCREVHGSRVDDGCKNDYASSEIKYVVDAWKTAQAPQALEARLITYEELTTDLGCSSSSCANSSNSWLYNSNYGYWTSSHHNIFSYYVWGVGIYDLYTSFVNSKYGVVRPVIVLPKSALN